MAFVRAWGLVWPLLSRCVGCAVCSRCVDSRLFSTGSPCFLLQTEAEIRGLCIKSREVFMSQPILLELEAPIKICGTPLCVPSRAGES